jgi:hypothetical protein
VQKHSVALEVAEQQTRNLSQAFDENIVRTIEAIDITVGPSGRRGRRTLSAST